MRRKTYNIFGLVIILLYRDIFYIAQADALRFRVAETPLHHHLPYYLFGSFSFEMLFSFLCEKVFAKKFRAS